MGTDNVHQAMTKLTRLLEDAHIPYAVVDAMALSEYGYRRVTVDIDLLLTREGLAAFKTQFLGRGYAEEPCAEGDAQVDHEQPEQDRHCLGPP